MEKREITSIQASLHILLTIFVSSFSELELLGLGEEG